MGELALWLRAQRRLAGMTYSQLAAHTGFSATSLSRAAGGERLPSLAVVEAFAQGCGGDPRKAAALWRRARYTAHQKTHDEEQVAMLPDYIRSFAQLRAAVLDLYRRAGSPSLRRLEATADGRYGGLPRSSVSRLLRGQAIPRKDLLIAFVRACSASGDVETGVWEGAWERARQTTEYDLALRRGVSGDDDEEEQLRSTLRTTEQRLKQLARTRAAHMKQRAEFLAKYRALADIRPRSPRGDGNLLGARFGEDTGESRMRELLQYLVAADSATNSVQQEIDAINHRLAVLGERLTEQRAMDASQDVPVPTDR